MKLFTIFLILAIYGAVAKPQDSSAPASGSGEVGGCSAGGNGDAQADGAGSASGDGSVSASGSESGPNSSSGYTYQISARRVEQVTPPSQPVMYMYYQVSPRQNITYFVDITAENPLVLEVYTEQEGNVVYTVSQDDGLNACDDYEDGTWEYVIVKIIQKGILPDGHCPVKTGNYFINSNVDPFTVTFSEMIKCGDYGVITNLFRNDTWAMQLYFLFTIEDDGNCIAE